MKTKQPTQEQIKEFWEWCGFRSKETTNKYHEPITVLLEPPYFDSLIVGEPKIDLSNLFKYAVPLVIKRLESRFDDKTNLGRGLELLFQKWIDKIREDYSLEDALFWAIWEVVHSD